MPYKHPWKIVEIARHKDRPRFRDYISRLFSDFVELRGDRVYRDDPVIIGGFAKFGKNDSERKVMIVGHHKEADVNLKHQNRYGMPFPEGYRKATRLMDLAEKYSLPVLTFIDTPGAAANQEAEERGISQAIAKNMVRMSRLRVPIITSVIGEGGSGGALGLSLGDRILMQKHAYYSVISPEGCASILWKPEQRIEKIKNKAYRMKIDKEDYRVKLAVDQDLRAYAAESLKLRADDLLEFGVIDEIVSEPWRGAHKNHKSASNYLGNAIKKNLDEVSQMSIENLIAKRFEKWRNIGNYFVDEST